MTNAADATAKDSSLLVPSGRPTTRGECWAAYAVHAYTASGVLFIFLAVKELFAESPSPAKCFVWLLVAVLIDASDGPLARRCHVKTRAPQVSGRTIDDIVDYLGFTFVPLLIVWRMDWLPFGQSWSWVWIVPPLITSLFGFANTNAKLEAHGFFSGFPSYWNVFAYYAGIWHAQLGAWPVAVVLEILAIATVLPIRFIYPNLAPHPWRAPLLIGAAIWSLLLLAMLFTYPTPPTEIYWLSLLYPLAYAGLSIHLDLKTRKHHRRE